MIVSCAPRYNYEGGLIPGIMVLRIWDVEHGACAMLHHMQKGVAERFSPYPQTSKLGSRISKGLHGFGLGSNRNIHIRQ